MSTVQVSEIRKLHDTGLFERGMFHDAALSLFPLLTYFWKKFCLQRYAPLKVEILDADKLILKERNNKGDIYKSKVPRSRMGSNVNVIVKNTGNALASIRIPHVAHGVTHLLNRLEFCYYPFISRSGFVLKHVL